MTVFGEEEGEGAGGKSGGPALSEAGTLSLMVVVVSTFSPASSFSNTVGFARALRSSRYVWTRSTSPLTVRNVVSVMNLRFCRRSWALARRLSTAM